MVVGVNKPKRLEDKPTVELAKDLVQAGIGVAIVVLLLAKVGFAFVVEGEACTAAAWPRIGWLAGWLVETSPLKIVGEALAFSAAIELAYMLFTPKPDEAVQPLILGVAAAALIAASQETVDIRGAATVAVLSLVIGLLFLIRQYFALDVEGEEESPRTSWATLCLLVARIEFRLKSLLRR
ncbi:hypothetical protein [Caulobacter soli]|uniref:hypothetical protein n=1 Tax=Caulobacter soli TaxID=2708539 RepID=UPI0013ED5C66|nr:hypothetical protein [Caulobacter soli]